jgi:hypothetical protein
MSPSEREWARMCGRYTPKLNPKAVKAVLAHRDEFHPEIHPTAPRTVSPFQTVLLLVILAGVYVGVQLYEDNVAQREEINRLKSIACPDTLGKQKLAFSDFAKRDFLRPKFTRLACYYKEGMKT